MCFTWVLLIITIISKSDICLKCQSTIDFPSQSLCILPPSPQDYTSERCLQSCLPSLHSLGIVDLDKAPCLMALLKNLHLVLHDQYSYEEVCLNIVCICVHEDMTCLVYCTPGA